MKDIKNKLIHLTNDCVQKKCEEYGKFEAGNKVIIKYFFIFNLTKKIKKIKNYK